MRPTDSNATQYQPGEPPNDPAQLPLFLRQEFAKMKAALDTVAAGHLEKTYSAPQRPRAGDIRYADGTTFKPNGVGGEGIWYYNGATWILMG